MAKPSKQRATFYVSYPVKTSVVNHPVVKTLRYWNTHYKAMHEWEDGRVEVKFDRRVKGYNDPSCEMLDFGCPYCSQRLYYRPESVHAVKGNITCAHCRKQFGVHPSGQVFMVRPVHHKVAEVTLLKDKVMKWAQSSTHYLDATILPPRKGDDAVAIELEYYQYDDPSKFDKGLVEFLELLEESGFEYRRGDA